MLFILILPKHFLETIDSQRIAFVLSKKISRKELFYQELISVFAISFLMLPLNMLIYLTIYLVYGISATSMIFMSLMFPFTMALVYTFVMFLSLITNSYGFTIFILFFEIIFLSPIIHSKGLFFHFVGETDITDIIFKVLKIAIPQVPFLIEFLTNTKIEIAGFENVSVFLSFIPVMIGAYYLLQRKEFC